MKTELERLKAEIQTNYTADIAAVNQLLGRYSPERQQAQKKLTALFTANTPHKSTSQIVEELIKSSNEPFSVPSIRIKLFQVTHKKSSYHDSRIISQVINKLRQREPSKIKEVVRGIGSRSGTYEYIKP